MAAGLPQAARKIIIIPGRSYDEGRDALGHAISLVLQLEEARHHHCRGDGGEQETQHAAPHLGDINIF